MIRILHISDLHASISRIEDISVLVRAMFEDVADFSAEKPVDLVVFSGDVANRGKAAEFKLARELLIDPLMQRLQLDSSRIVLAPGNHDVDREKIVPVLEESLARGLTSREKVNSLLDSPEGFQHVAKRLENWNEFHEHVYGGAQPEQPGPLGFVHHIELDRRSVGVAALNSAWRSSSNQDRGRLLLGSRQVESALSAIADADLRLVVVHHPLNWLAQFDAEQARAEFENRGVIVLSGHEHKADPAERRSPYGEVVHLSTGSLYLNREYPNSFEIVDVDVDDRKVVAHFRRWQGKRGKFDADLETAAGGREEFDLPSPDRRRHLGHPHFSTVMRSIATTAQELLPQDLAPDSPASSIEDVLVEPRFSTVPFNEAEAAAALAGQSPNEETNPLGRTEEARAGPQVVLVAGPPQAGVSSALLWLLAQRYRMDVSRMPALLRARDSSLGTAKTAVTLAKASTVFGHRQSNARDPDLYLGIDDFDEASPRKQDLIIKFIRATPRHLYIVGCREDWAGGVASRLEEAGISYTLAFLAPLASDQLHQLGSAMNRTPSDVERIEEMMSRQGFPRDPSTATALLATMAAQPSAEPDLSDRALLEGYVNFLFNRGQLTVPGRLEMSFRERVHLLGEFAHALYKRPDQAMKTIDAEAFLVEYFARKGLENSASRVLRILTSGTLLEQRNARVSFRHSALLNFFMGHWMLEHPSHRREVLADCESNADVIRHAAALRRGDEEILSAVDSYARSAIEAAKSLVTTERVDEMLDEIGSTGCWTAERLEHALTVLPPRRMIAAIHLHGDRIPDALIQQYAQLAGEDLATANGLNEAVCLLSDVLESSELLDNVALKRKMLVTAIWGWVLLIGLLIADDANREAFRSLMDEFIEGGRDDKGHRGRKPASITPSVVVAVVVFVVTISAQGRLARRNLATITEACLDDDEFAGSPTARCLATWLHAYTGAASWPHRLEKLLETLSEGSLLRDATLATAAHLFRSSPDEPEVHELELILVEKIAPMPERRVLATRKHAQRQLATQRRLQQSRRAYQQWRPAA